MFCSDFFPQNMCCHVELQVNSRSCSVDESDTTMHIPRWDTGARAKQRSRIGLCCDFGGMDCMHGEGFASV